MRPARASGRTRTQRRVDYLLHLVPRVEIGLYRLVVQYSVNELPGTNRLSLEEVEQRVIEEITEAEREALDSREHRMPAPAIVTQGVYSNPD